MLIQRTRSRSCRVGAAVCAAVLVLSAAAVVAQEEIERHGSYYEDDAWYDVTEWLDGTDYNPTDERGRVWDNETYNRMRDTGPDTDDDQWYGYDKGEENDDDNWYYDYYDDGYRSYSRDRDGELYDFASEYFDYDGDGFYDAFFTYFDEDGDGEYEEVNYYALGDVSDKQRAASEQRLQKSSQRHLVQGEVERLKTIEVRSGTHLVARLDPHGDPSVIVDLGPHSAWQDKAMKEGVDIQVHGPIAEVGDKRILVAQNVEMDGKMIDLERNPLKLTGRVKATRGVMVRGEKHLLLVLTHDDGDYLVDLGPAEQFEGSLSSGEAVAVRGVPTRVQDGRRVLMATHLTADETTHEIERSGRRQQSGSAETSEVAPRRHQEGEGRPARG